MNNQIHRKSTTKGSAKSCQLTEDRVREIAKEEIIKYMGQRAKEQLALINEDFNS